MRSLLHRSRSRLQSTATLPQISAALSISDHSSAGGHRFALVNTAATGHYTVLLSVTTALEHWAQLFAYPVISMGEHAPDVVGVTAVCDMFPATADAYRQWGFAEGHHHLRADTDIDVRAHIAITFAAQSDATRSDAAEMGVEVGKRLPTLLGSLAGAGIDAVPMISSQVTDLACSAYNELAHSDAAFSDIGPADTHHRVRNLFCHDGFVSSSWVIAPHVLDEPVIDELVAPAAATPRQRLAITYRSTRLAAGVDEADPVVLLHAPTLQRFGAILTITEPLGRVPSADALRSRLPLFARLGVRKGFDRQAELFAACIGIGVLLPEHGEITDDPLKHRHRTSTSTDKAPR